MNTPFVFKRCTKCGEYKVASTVYFSKDKSKKSGLNCWCKECARQYRKANKDKIKKYQQEYRKDNIEYFKKYEQANKDKRREYFKAYGKEYRKDNKEQIKKYDKEYRKDNKEQIKKYNKEYYQANKEQIKEHQQEYNKTPQGQVVAFNGQCRRRAREESQGRGITGEQWLEMMNYFNWQCAYSGISISKQEDRSIDHIVPVSNGGENEIWNMAPMYISYNKSKNASDMLEWYKEQDFYDEDRLAKIYEWQEYAFNKYGVVEELI